MSAHTKAGVQLTAYESEQVEHIAVWKSTPPNPFAELFKSVTLPVANLVEKVVPDKLILFAIEKAYAVSELVAGQNDIKRQAGVHELGELREKPLEECDQLAHRVRVAAQTWATIEGAATGAGGVLTTLLDVPLLFVLSLRTILRIGHCYGYTLDHPHDRTLVLGILIIATSGSLATKRQRLDQLREIKHLLVEETQEEILADEALSILFQLEIFEEVPGIGAISGALLNWAFIRRIEITARHVFQERWLEDNGKVRIIKPALVHDRHLVGGWRGTLGRAAYASSYSIGFGAAVPVYAAASLVRSIAKQAGLPTIHRIDTIPPVLP
jgi:EcsC protein family